MLKKYCKKTVAIILLIIIGLSTTQNIVYAVDITSATIEDLGDCEHHLIAFNEEKGVWTYITTTMVGYRENGNLHYAYCLDASLKGVGEAASYTVTVDNVLQDERIYRVIINGFPYNNMGLSDGNAFAVTKQAVYSIIYNRDVRSYYKSKDEVGNQMLDALENLVNIGRNGTQKPTTVSNITVNKIGDVVEDSREGYYSQVCSVSSSIEMEEYTITALNGMPEGTYTADLSGNAKSTFTNGEQFKIVVPENRINGVIKGTVNVSGKIKCYPVFYGKSPSSDLQDYALTYRAYTTLQANGNIEMDIYQSALKIVKIDKDTKQGIANVGFSLKYNDGTYIGEYKTNNSGEIYVDKLKKGTIVATEISTNEKYILKTEPINVELKYKETQTVTIENEHKKGNLTIYKVDKDNNKIGLGNVRFDLFSVEFNKVIGTCSTDANGKLEIKNLRIGDYKLLEKETNKWYNLAEDMEIKVEWNITNSVTVKNELKKGRIKVIKVDSENTEYKIPGVKFNVMDENKNVLETIITNSNGEAVTKEYAIRDYAKLYLQEIETNEMYELNDKITEIKLEENQIKTMVFENEKIKGQIKILKVAEKDNIVTGDKAGTPLKNVEFEILDENKKLIEIVKTDENGEAISSKLTKGTKYVREKNTAKWYQLDTNEYKVVIKKHGEIKELNIKNKPDEPSVETTKTGIEQTSKNQEIKYDCTIKNTGNVGLDDFTWYDYIPYEYIKPTKIITGTYNQDLLYGIYYKTNKKDYTLLKDNLSTTVNNYIDFTNIQLEEDEYITEIKMYFGSVDIDFKSIENIQLFAVVNDSVKNEDKFTNKTSVIGQHGIEVRDDDDHTTEVYEKQIIEKLPKTGF